MGKTFSMYFTNHRIKEFLDERGVKYKTMYRILQELKFPCPDKSLVGRGFIWYKFAWKGEEEKKELYQKVTRWMLRLEKGQTNVHSWWKKDSIINDIGISSYEYYIYFNRYLRELINEKIL